MTPNKSAPAGAETPVNPGLTAKKERLVIKHSKTNKETTPQEVARVFLKLAASDLEKARRTRSYYITLARRYGVSNVEIGRSLGLSEARIRQILAEANGDMEHVYGGGE